MHRIQLLFLVALFVCLALSAPTKPKQKRSFKVPRIRNENYVPNGKKALKRALFKFGFGDISFVPSGEVAARIKAATNSSIEGQTGSEDGETTASPTQNDAQFLSPVTVGGQTLIMNFDSGSSDTWVFNTNLPAASQRGHTIYDPAKSTTFTASNNEFNITYGDGSFSAGAVGFETVDIGGTTVDQQAIGLPDVVAPSFVTDSASNGLVGLAFSKLNTMRPEQQKTFFDNVMPELSLPVFTAQLKHGEVGAYEFGNIDTTAFTGDLSTVAVDDSRGFWEVDSASCKVGGITTQIPNSKAIIDTGTSLMLVGDEMLLAYWGQVADAQLSQEAGGVIFPCGAQLPDLEVAIGASYMALVPGSVMNFAEVGRDRTTGQTFCFGGLQSSQDIPFAIYGDVFFKSQYVVFDGSGPSLGIAPHA